MRPTIPLGPWRLAVDLEATRAVNALESRPTRGCHCDVCRVWAAVHAERLPITLATELQRIGIAPSQPTEAFESTGPTGPVGLRVSYVAVGRIQSGPAELVQFPETGPGRVYAPLRAAPDYLALAVAYQHRLATPPDWLAGVAASLLAIDLYVQIPRSAALAARRARDLQPGATV